MKKLIPLVILSFSCTLIYGQLCIKSVQISRTFDREMLNELSGSLLLNTIKGDHPYQPVDFDGYDLSSMSCENPMLRVGVNLGRPNQDHFQMFFGTTFIWNRADAVQYRDMESRENLSFTSINNQIGLDFSIQRNLSVSFVNIYLGLGTSIGYSYGGKLFAEVNPMSQQEYQSLIESRSGEFIPWSEEVGVIYGSQTEVYQTLNSFDQRFYAQLGIGFEIAQRIELGLEGRYGYANRLLSNRQALGGKLTSLGIQMKYMIHHCR